MPPKKTKKKAAESLPGKAAEKPKVIARRINTDDIQKEIDDCEHIARNVNIDLDTPGITGIRKVISYDFLKKKIVKAEYEIYIKE